MTSLFMGQLMTNPVPADEKVVRSTVQPVNIDKPAAMAPDPPEQGEVRTDPDPDLGLATRQLASEWTQGTPIDPGPLKAGVDQTTASTEIINSQVSSSGTAAGREMSGQTHRSLSYAYGIEPPQDLRSNGAFGNEYFKRTDREIQEGAGNYMQTPPGYLNPNIAALGKEASRDATGNSIYDLFYHSVMSGR